MPIHTRICQFEVERQALSFCLGALRDLHHKSVCIHTGVLCCCSEQAAHHQENSDVVNVTVVAVFVVSSNPSCCMIRVYFRAKVTKSLPDHMS